MGLKKYRERNDFVSGSSEYFITGGGVIVHHAPIENWYYMVEYNQWEEDQRLYLRAAFYDAASEIWPLQEEDILKYGFHFSKG